MEKRDQLITFDYIAQIPQPTLFSGQRGFGGQPFGQLLQQSPNYQFGLLPAPMSFAGKEPVPQALTPDAFMEMRHIQPVPKTHPAQFGLL